MGESSSDEEEESVSASSWGREDLSLEELSRLSTIVDAQFSPLLEVGLSTIVDAEEAVCTRVVDPKEASPMKSTRDSEFAVVWEIDVSAIACSDAAVPMVDTDIEWATLPAIAIGAVERRDKAEDTTLVVSKCGSAVVASKSSTQQRRVPLNCLRVAGERS